MVVSDRKLFIAWFVVAVVAIVAFFVIPAAAATDGEQICSGHRVDLVSNVHEVAVIAPDGQLISGYCVKAGSATPGCGPMTTLFTHPLESVTIEYDHYLAACDGKAISHYAVFYTDVPSTTTSSTTTTPTTTTTTTTTVVTTPTTIPTGVLSAGAAQAIVGDPSFTG
jgi:hypothetical protein